MHLAILGPIAVGKTTVGTRVADRLGLPWCDSDDQILARSGKSGRDIALEQGVGVLHALELQMLNQALSHDQPVVVSPAASVVDVPEGCAALARRDVLCVLLWADVDTIMRRVSTRDHRRPMDRRELERLIRKRRPVWDHLATRTFPTEGRDAKPTVDAIVGWYRDQKKGASGGARLG